MQTFQKATSGPRRAEAQRRRKYVYLLQSQLTPEHYYTGVTGNLKTRLTQHNTGKVTHTKKYRPWRLKTYIAFSDEKRAFEFERYLKSGSGRAFAKKRL